VLKFISNLDALVNSRALNHSIAMTKKPAKPTKTNRRKARAVEIDFLDVPACTNTAVRRASRRLSNLYDDAFEAVGLKATQVSLLAEVDRITSQNGGVPPTLQDLAQKLAIQISALTHALRPLVRDGLIELLQDEQDGRTKRAVLTTAGAASLEEAGRRWSVINQRIEHVLGAESAATLRALSDHVASDEFLAAYHHVKAQNG
jgi:DNA-binding MarR family transcriptional regulator